MKRPELPTLGAVENPGALVNFGDPTYWANSESFTSSIRFSTTTLGVDASARREVRWARPLGSPARRLGVAFRSEAAGTLADGLYYYLLSLAARTDGVSSVAGRTVLIR